MAQTAPWRHILLSHIDTLACPAFALSTVSPGPIPIPHVRTLVFRGFYGDLPINPHNPTRGNDGWESDLIAFTTDKRMEKIKDLGGQEGLNTSSGNYPNSEACFWIPGTQNPLIGKQWRIRGRSVILPPSLDKQVGESERVSETRRLLVEALRHRDGEETQGEFDFAKEYRGHFANLSPQLRGSFRNPPPGQSKEKGDFGMKPSRKIADDELDNEEALTNFRVSILDPERVEYLDLATPSRTVWFRVGSESEKAENLESGGKLTGNWREVEVWP